MGFLGFTSYKTDADVWMSEAKNNYRAAHWEYILLYVDNCLCVFIDHESIIRNEIEKYFKVKEALIKELDIYLGNKICKVELETGAKCWALELSQYIQEACRNVQKCLKERQKLNDSNKHYLPKSPAKGPLSNQYGPKIDVTPKLDANNAAYYQSLI